MGVREASVAYADLSSAMADAVPQGYKQTEVGVIPEEWFASAILDLASKRSNAIVGGPFGSDLVSKDYVSVGIPVVRGQNMATHYISGDFAFVTKSKAAQLRANLACPGDLVFTQRGTLGQVSLVPPHTFDEYVISQSQMKLTLDTRLSDAEFVYQYFISAGGQNQILESAIQTGVPHTNLGIFRGYRVPLPPTKAEQQAIAEALSDADALIESLQQLIVKKRRIKQGAMQALLTGKQRLPGFSGEWQAKALGDLCEMWSGGTPPSSNPDFYDGDIPWVSISDMTNGGKRIVATERNLTVAGLANSAAQMFPVGTVLYAMYASLGECSIAGISLCTSQAILGIKVKARLSADFLYHLLTSRKSVVKAMGQQGTQSNLNKGMVQDMEVRLPQLHEQVTIADILTDMDIEIAALETRLGKTREIKQGMMQALLTGRIRLV